MTEETPVGMIADVTMARGQGRSEQTTTVRVPRRARTVVAAMLSGLTLGLLSVFGLPAAPASAHAVLIGSTPAQGSLIPEAPTQVVLTFTEGVDPIQGKVRVIAPDGARADTDEPRASGTQLIIPLKTGGPRGTYLVTFRVVSADSHPVTGALTFSVGFTSTPPSADGTDAGASAFVTVAFPVARWIGYAGLLLLVGALLVLALLWPNRLERGGPSRVIWLGAALLAVGTLAELALQVPYVAGGEVGGSDVREVLSGQFGAAHLVRLGVLGAALILTRPIVQGRGWGADRVLLAVLGTVAIATWSVSGHPSASPVPMVTVVADMIHLASMSVWLGGLVMLVAFVLPRANQVELAAIVPVWSHWATYAVGALIATGIAQALVEVGSVGALISTTYGWTILVKVGLVAVVLAIAFVSRRLVGAIAARADGAARRLRGVVAAEAAVAALVLAAASVLVQTTPARTAAAEAGAQTIQSAVLRDKLFTLTVDVQPALTGLNEIHLYATTPDGQPADVRQWQVRASLPAQGIEPIEAAILPVTRDHATGQVGLPQAGTWTFMFTLRTSEVDQATVASTFVVR